MDRSLYQPYAKCRKTDILSRHCLLYIFNVKNKTEAKQKLLRLNSQYGKMTKESVLEFAEDIDLYSNLNGEIKMRIYLSGKITGREKEDYTRQFARAESFYKTGGFDVVNPVTIGEVILKK